jgi:spermidine/putrescine-binding protein
VDADFEIIILKHSLELIERVNALWSEYLQSGTAMVAVHTTAPSAPTLAEYFDYVGWKQLVAEGWGETKKLEAVKIVVPKGHFLWFRTWLMHAGAEFNPGQGDGGIRLHYYLLNYLLEGQPTSINMQANPLQVRGGCLE